VVYRFEELNMTTQVLFIRHGETDWNRIKRIQGHIDIPLAATGFVQAKQLANRLQKEGMQLDAVYCSDLLRAQQTARPFAEALKIPVQLDKGLRERWYGAFEGHDSDEIRAKFPVEFEAWQSRDRHFQPPGGESQQAFYDRVVSTVQGIVSANPGRRIACVAHGGVLDCVYRWAKQLPLNGPRDWVLLNASINVVEFENDTANVISWGDVAHLTETSEDDGLKPASSTC
jgi:probable phosphoglycerate mutase